jgi:thioredoxin 1
MKHILLVISSFFFVLAASCQQPAKQGTVLMETIPAQDFEKKIRLAGVHLIDVRTPEEFAEGHIEGAKNINYNDPSFAAEVKKLEPSKTILVYCLSGGRSSSSMSVFAEAGFKKIYNLEGGKMKWTSSGFPLVTNEGAKPAAAGMNEKDYAIITQSAPIVVVDFNATWCAPCKKLAPILEQVEKDYAGKVKVVKIDVDANRSLAAAKHIDGIPFLEIYKNGKLTMQHEGLTTYEDLVKLLPL